MTSGTRKPSAFDNVPNEVLNLIISSIPLVEDFSYISYEKDGSSHQIHQILALMHVSRRFRFTMLQHSVWLDFKFEFEVLAVSTHDDYLDQLFPTMGYLDETSSRFPSRTNLPARITKLLTLLFGDSNFTECLKRKTAWRFQSLEVLFAVLAHLPTFTKSARAVALELEGTDAALSRLRECEHLIHLDIEAELEASLNLDWISRFLPSLKKLIIDFPSRWTGSLKGLEQLDEYTAQIGSEIPLDGTSFLPISSAKTLTRMDLSRCYLEHTSLKMFTSLKHLRAQHEPVDADLAELIKDLPVRLSSLETSVKIECPRALQIIGLELNERWILWDCWCLGHLKKICLGLHCVTLATNDDDFPAYYIDNSMEVVTKVVNKLQLLEDVEIWGGFDIEGVHVLGELQNLKRLRWVISKDRYSRKGKGSQDLTSQVIDRFRRMGKEVDSVTIEVIPYRISDGEFVGTVFEE
jgi:hypothetical protein